MYPSRDYVEAGGLMTNATTQAEAAEHLAVLVQQVLQGASPGATTVIKAAIRPYSIAIAPASSLKRR